MGLDLQDRIQVCKRWSVSQSILEDVLEALAGAIGEELGYQELYKWTEMTLGPMIEEFNRRLKGQYHMFPASVLSLSSAPKMKQRLPEKIP